MNIIKQNILIICGDPGGANALIPIIKKLAFNPHINLINFAYNESENLFRNANIQYSNLDEVKHPDNIKNILLSHKIKVVLAATSVNQFNWELKFISIANKLGIKTISILDFWSNYILRFKQDNNEMVLPYAIIVMDDYAKDQMLKVGFPANKLIVFGNPLFDKIKFELDDFSNTKKQQILNSFNVKPNHFLITFISQPIEEFYGIENSDTFIGYTQHSVLRQLISILEKVSENNIVLIIRPHPREKRIDYINSKKIKIHISSTENYREVLLTSDLVIGMNSMLLVEACLLGVPVVSLQPNLIGEDMLPTNKTQASLPIYLEKDAESVIENLISIPKELHKLKKTLSKFPYHFNATANIIDYIFKQLDCEISNASAYAYKYQ